MKFKNKIFLPGIDEQINTLINSVHIKDKSILVMGGGSEDIAEKFYQKNALEVYLIIDDEDSLIKSRLALAKNKEIVVRLMDYDNTDFKAERFDMVYSQGSTGTKKRNKIIKEIFRILKPGGHLCIGEIVSLTKTPPQFVKDIWDKSSLSPLYHEELKNYYLSKNFELTLEQDLTETLIEFYSVCIGLLEESSKDFSEDEEKSVKKIFKTYGHEANAFLKLGGDKFIGFTMLVLRKVQE